MDWGLLLACELEDLRRLQHVIEAQGVAGREAAGKVQPCTGVGDALPSTTPPPFRPRPRPVPSAQAVLYLSRVAAKQTIGHLVHEVALLIDQPEVVDEGGSPYAVSSPDGTPRVGDMQGGGGGWGGGAPRPPGPWSLTCPQ